MSQKPATKPKRKPIAFAALKRAAKRAVELARQTRTPAWVLEGEKLVDVTQLRKPRKKNGHVDRASGPCRIRTVQRLLITGDRPVPKPSSPTARSEAAIWERIVHPSGPMTREVAQHIVDLEFSDDERQRMHELAERNRAGTLAPGDDEELDNFCRVGSTLSLLKSRARQVLKSRRRVS